MKWARAVSGSACTALLSIPLAVAIAWSNGISKAASIAALIVEMWVLFFLPSVAAGLAAVSFRPDHPRRTGFVVSASALAFWFWFVRMEPAHQFLSATPHLNGAGILDLLLVLALSASMILASRLHLAWVLVVAVAGGVILEGVARFQVPDRDRQEWVRTLPVRKMARQDPRGKVLVIGIDGLEWRSVHLLLRQGRLPAMRRLFESSRDYQMDNLAMRQSPEIWTAIYTGVISPESGIDSFQRWKFRGVDRPIVTLPKAGVHPVLFLDRVLPKLEFLRLWRHRLVSNREIVPAPFWTVLSAAGKRVAVINPLPTEIVPEEVNGVFVVTRDSGFVSFGPDRTRTYPLPQSYPRTSRGFIREESSRVPTAVRILGDETWDVAIYYTKFLDAVQHLDWELGLTGVVVEGYEQADRTIATLMTACGPCTVVLISDHGWDYGDFEHFASPMGVLSISPSSNPGDGGRADVRAVASTVLALAGVGVQPGMRRPLDAANEISGPALTVRRRFVNEDGSDPEHVRTLRALGYIW